jgi:hypothetical protein
MGVFAMAVNGDLRKVNFSKEYTLYFISILAWNFNRMLQITDKNSYIFELLYG